MKRLIALLLICTLSSGCATYQMHRPLDGSSFVTLSDNVREAMIEAQMIADPTITREEAELRAREKFLEHREDIMEEYRRIDALASLGFRIAQLLIVTNK